MRMMTVRIAICESTSSSFFHGEKYGVRICKIRKTKYGPNRIDDRQYAFRKVFH